jgi:hypothetical protein
MLSRDMGTRHRAAIGITEETDAVAVVVSEETGLVSFVEGGRIKRGLDATQLRGRIFDSLEVTATPDQEDKPTPPTKRATEAEAVEAAN